MKIYIVTAGCYSNYHIESVFTDRKKAKKYANLNSDRTIETYETQDNSIISPTHIKAWYKPNDNCILCIEDSNYVMEDYWYGDRFGFTATLSDRLTEDIEMKGEKSPLLLKIAQDRWAQYKAEHMEEIEEDEQKIITITPEQGAEAFKKFAAVFNANFSKKAEEKHEN